MQKLSRDADGIAQEILEAIKLRQQVCTLAKGLARPEFGINAESINLPQGELNKLLLLLIEQCIDLI